jgi:CheY-like chemotaxis protein
MSIPDWFKRHILPDYWQPEERDRFVRKRILLVTSQWHIARLVQVNLERQGYDVSWLRFGEDAHEEAPLLEPSVIVLDTKLSDVPICEMVCELRRMPETVAVPIIAIVHDSESEEKYRESAGPRDGFVRWPCNPLEIIGLALQVSPLRDDRPDGHVNWGSRF